MTNFVFILFANFCQNNDEMILIAVVFYDIVFYELPTSCISYKIFVCNISHFKKNNLKNMFNF